MINVFQYVRREGVLFMYLFIVQWRCVTDLFIVSDVVANVCKKNNFVARCAA